MTQFAAIIMTLLLCAGCISSYDPADEDAQRRACYEKTVPGETEICLKRLTGEDDNNPDLFNYDPIPGICTPEMDRDDCSNALRGKQTRIPEGAVILKRSE